MAEIEKVAKDRYRIRAHDSLLHVTAQDMRDIYDWCLLHMRELEQEAKAEQPERNPWDAIPRSPNPWDAIPPEGEH